MVKMSAKREFTKNILMDAFWQLYKSQGIQKITIKKVTDKAGYNRITFYDYFRDIYDVLDCIETKILSEIEQKILTAFGNAESISNAAFTEYAVILYNQYQEYFVRLFSDNREKIFEKKLQNCFKVLLKHYFENFSDFNSKYILEFYTSGLVGSIKMWYSSGCDIPIKIFLNTIYTVIFVQKLFRVRSC
ncbi:MAG: TetR/AcrR family transcriptional regulator [Ruminiclostridium sp.]